MVDTGFLSADILYESLGRNVDANSESCQTCKMEHFAEIAFSH